MCEETIDSEQVEAMRRAFASLRTAAQRLLCCRGLPESGEIVTALSGLRAASATDPASFVTDIAPQHRHVLRLPTLRAKP